MICMFVINMVPGSHPSIVATKSRGHALALVWSLQQLRRLPLWIQFYCHFASIATFLAAQSFAHKSYGIAHGDLQARPDRVSLCRW